MKLLVLLMVMYTIPVYGGKVLHVKDSQTIEINDGISRRNVFDVIEQVAEKIKTERQINFVINSPGGSIVWGMWLLKEMHKAQSKGIKFVCIVDGFAMSMAFVILNECDKRYVQQDSLLLWHPGRIGMNGDFTKGMLKPTAEQLAIFDEYIEGLIKPKLKIPDNIYDYYGDNDMLVTAKRLKKLAPHYIIVIKDYRRKK